MAATSCIFCKILSKQIPAPIIAENEHVIVIADIAPKAPTHYLIIPRKHITNMNELTEQDSALFGSLGIMAQQLSTRLGKIDFRYLINNGKNAGQSVFHLHAHFLAGKTYSDL